MITANHDGVTYVLGYRRKALATLGKKRKANFFQPGILSPDGGSASIPNVENFPLRRRQYDPGFCKAMAKEANAYVRDRACVYMDALVDVRPEEQIAVNADDGVNAPPPDNNNDDDTVGGGGAQDSQEP